MKYLNLIFGRVISFKFTKPRKAEITADIIVRNDSIGHDIRVTVEINNEGEIISASTKAGQPSYSKGEAIDGQGLREIKKMNHAILDFIAPHLLVRLDISKSEVIESNQFSETTEIAGFASVKLGMAGITTIFKATVEKDKNWRMEYYWHGGSGRYADSVTLPEKMPEVVKMAISRAAWHWA